MVNELLPTERQVIERQMEKYRRAALSGDWGVWGSTLAQDAVVSPANIPPLHGREAAVEWARSLPKLDGFEIEVGEIVGFGSLAYAHGTYALEMTLPDGSRAQERGAWLQVHRRERDGSWPYLRVMFHSTEPAPNGPRP